MRGRKAVAAEERERRGDKSRGKSQSDRIIIGGRAEKAPTPPPGLTPGMRAIWNAVCTDLIEAHIFDAVDIYAIEQFCVVLGRAREARQVLHRPGKTLEARLLAPTVRGTMAHPLLAVERESLKEARLMGEMLGLSPSARTRLGLKRPTGKTLKDMKGAGPESARAKLRLVASGGAKTPRRGRDEDDDDDD